eukprot:m.31475 g.31475  ORF g.31475 m.31475 type:complete len:427 (-) comp8322_c0_seq1:92-1372(-)
MGADTTNKGSLLRIVGPLVGATCIVVAVMLIEQDLNYRPAPRARGREGLARDERVPTTEKIKLTWEDLFEEEAAQRPPHRVEDTDGGMQYNQFGERMFALDLRISPQDVPSLPGGSAKFRCQQFNFSTIKSSQIIGYDPLIDTPEGLDLIHHIDLFMCDDSLADQFFTPQNCGSFSMFMHSQKGPCYQLQFAYDRGASGFRLPAEAGFELGPRTPISHLLLQIHYLLPKEKLSRTKKYIDTSGIRLYLTPDVRQFSAASMALLDYGVLIPPNNPSYHFEFECDESYLSDIIAKDIVNQTGVTFFGTHLHAHSRGKKLWVSHIRAGKEIGRFGDNQDYKGYGESQSYVFYQAKSEFRQGDSLQGHCIFNTSGKSQITPYGVTHGTEMCAFVLFYYPANPTRFHDVNHLCSLYGDTRKPNKLRLIKGE